MQIIIAFAFSCKRIIHPKHNAKYVLSIHHAVYINTPNKRELPYIPYNQAADINLKEVIKIHKLTVIDPCLFSVTDTTYIMVMEGNIEILDTNHDAEKAQFNLKNTFAKSIDKILILMSFHQMNKSYRHNFLKQLYRKNYPHLDQVLDAQV